MAFTLPACGRGAARTPTDEARAYRAESLVQLGELSAASRALTAEPLAVGSPATLAELTDPDRRPPEAYGPHDADVLGFQPDQPCAFPQQAFVACLQSARRGSAAGPSGATNEHLRIMLDDEEDSRLLHTAAELLARAQVPDDVLAAVRVGRVVALQKPNGRVRALVVGDVLRRLVGRVLAQQFGPQLQEACLPFQFGLSTSAGTEAVVCLLRAATEASPRATILSVDAVGAFDHVSRRAMLRGLLERPALRPLLPYARQFYAESSSYTWYDDAGHGHRIQQGEGGEQGDPLMPALYALAQHPALAELQGQLLPGEAVFAFLDDIYVVAEPERVRPLLDALSAALWEHARVRLHAGKTRIWNAAGEEPPTIADLAAASSSDPAWVGDWSLPPDQQGLTVLGAPLGHDAYVHAQLRLKRAQHDRLLGRIPQLSSLQAAWLLLLFCAAPRANHLLRVLPPHQTEAYARDHDAAVAQCLTRLLQLEAAPLPDPSLRTAQLALRFGGLGLRSAVAARQAAHWASWCDTLPVIQARAPVAADRLLHALQGHVPLPAAAAANQARDALRAIGYDAPAWASLLDASDAPPARGCAFEPGDALRGWQRHAAGACDERACETHLSDLTLASRALLLSQAGPHSARAITVAPTHEAVSIPNAQFRILLLRRLRLPLPLAPRTCSCRGRLDTFGDHRAACATSGVLAARAGPLERAVARVCREAGARVARNVRVADMNIDVPVADDRRIEVVANGLSLWHGSQLAVDATLVSPLTRTGEPHPRADVEPGRSVTAAARRKRHGTYPELLRARRCRLVVIALEVGGRFGTEAATFLRLLARHRAATIPAHLRPAAQTAWVARWAALLAVAAQHAFASSLLELPLAGESNGDDAAPELHEVLADGRWDRPPAASRVPPRQ